jgi:hypothetical protein
MLSIKTPEIIVAMVLSAVTIGAQNPAEALIDNQASLTNSVSISTKQLTTKKPVLVAINNDYWGPQSDFKVWMPGQIENNTNKELVSWSDATQTRYVIVHRDMPVEVNYYTTQQIRQLLQTSMRRGIASKGKVVKSTNLVIDGYPGLELLVQHFDGSLGEYRAFLVKGRMYGMGAVSRNELTTETVNFFDSFRVYPQQIGSSRR